MSKEKKILKSSEDSAFVSFSPCVHQLFEKQVTQTPHAPAVSFNYQEMTYETLNKKANQLAYQLQLRGVSLDTNVGICVRPSIEMVVGLLAILKAGGTYVPLDHSYPKERLTFMLEDAHVAVLLTQKDMHVDIPESLKNNVIVIDMLEATCIPNCGMNHTNNVCADNTAYIIYTSGSTGIPKGVAMTHKVLVNLLLWQLQDLRPLQIERTLQFAPISFDVSFQEIFATLCSGGCLVLPWKELRRDAIGLLHFLVDERITNLFLPFVALQQLAEAVDSYELIPNYLRTIITAGEQLQITPLIRCLFKKLSNCALYNQYGPTESHVVTTFKLIGTPDEWIDLPPIGRPITNAQIFLLDSTLQHVPIGIPGEIYIGGPVLAREYFNKPALTAERFIPNPYHNQLEERFYKTGDIGRSLLDGNIEFLGRLDHQVKIRGFRIELGEIESALLKHEAIREAIVLVQKEQTEEKLLAACVVLNRKFFVFPVDLKSYLIGVLPEYMVPSVFLILDTLPLTSSGKVDRLALAQMIQDGASLQHEYAPPRNALEELLLSMWTDVLKLKDFGIYDNFFAGGGNSLLAVRVISRLHSTLQVDVAVQNIFDFPTIAEFSVCVENILLEDA